MRLARLPHLDARAANDHRRAARDPRIARALDAIAARPAEAWTVASLARIAGLSRAAFARRFADEVGAPPLRYVTELRMRLAAERLVSGDDALAVIAVEVGYATEFALSRAFRRMVGDPPGVYRRRARAVVRGVPTICRAA